MKKASPSHGLAVAVVDPTTLLGRDVRSVLKERTFPAARVLLFHSSSAHAGLLTTDDDEAAFVAPLTPDALEPAGIAFLCGKAADSERFLSQRAADDCLAIDLSGVRSGGTFAVPSKGPSGQALPEGNLFLTYDPVAAVLADAVRIVDTLSPVSGATVAVDRPASELGRAALDELFQQAISLARFQSLPKEVFETQAVFNAFFPADTDAFNARVAEDVTRLLGRSLPLSLLSVRSGVFHGHLLRLELRIDGTAPVAESLRVAFQKSGAFEETDPESLAGPVEAAGRDETLLLYAASSGSVIRLGLAADHLRRTGAVMGVRLAEQAVKERGLLADA